MSLSGTTISNTNANITYNQLSFISSYSSVGSFKLSVYVNGLPAICGINSTVSCNYQFSSAIAPKIFFATPLNVSGSTNLTINGSNFGVDTTKLTVTIGSDNCLVITATNNAIVCKLASLSVGPQNLLVNLKGNAINKYNYKYSTIY